MISLADWKKERKRFIQKIELFEVPEEELADFFKDLSPSVNSNLPQCHKKSFVIVMYPTISCFLEDELGRSKIKKRMCEEFDRAGFRLFIKEIGIRKPEFYIEYIIEEKYENT